MSCTILPVSDENIRFCVARLRAGGLVAFPTETVYGLGADAMQGEAVAAIYAAKGRPSFNPLIVHVPSLQMAEHYGEFTPLAVRLAQAFWPGALTLVVARKPTCGLSLLVSAGLDSVALRVPAHPLAQRLLQESGLPIAAPSANRSGRISPTEAAHVAEELPEISVLDGGRTDVGLESTVIDARGDAPILLRYGSITPDQIAQATGKSVLFPEESGVFHSPGMMASHYAPDRPLRLDATSARTGEAFLAFGAAEGDLNLSPSGNLQEAAANLFAYLRALDKPEFSGIAVMPIPMEGLGLAINDRLRRAAAR